MGIPKFANQFNNAFKIMTIISNINKLNNYDNILFDFNSIIYNVIEDINFDDIKDNDLNDFIVEKTIESLFNHINNVVFTNLKINLFIFLDGCPSINKMYEQRHRRVMRMHSTETINNSLDQWKKFSSIHVSPGTLFMKSLENKLLNLKSIPKFNDILNILYVSTSSEYDEAEIKLMRYLRSIISPDHKYLIYSPDADLVLLAMTMNNDNIDIIKIIFDKNIKKYTYSFIDVSKFTTVLYDVVKLYHDFVKYTIEKYIDTKDKEFENNFGYDKNHYINILNSLKMHNSINYDDLNNKYNIFIGNIYNTENFSEIKKKLNIVVKRFEPIKEYKQTDIIHGFIKKNIDSNLLNFVNILMLRILINDKYFVKSCLKHKKSKFIPNKTNIIQDLVLLFIFFGNDFIPKLPSMDLDEELIHWFLIMYLFAIYKSGKYLVNDNIINYDILKIILKEFRTIEYNFINNYNIYYGINDKTKKIINVNPYMAIKCESVDFHYYSNKINKNDCFKKRNKNYLIELNKNCIKYDNFYECNINKICENYLIGFDWIKEAYFNNIINYWIYPTIFSPSIFSLYKYFKHNKVIVHYENKVNYKLISTKMLFALVNAFDFNKDKSHNYDLAKIYDKKCKKSIIKIAKYIDSYYLKKYNHNYYVSENDSVYLCFLNKYLNKCSLVNALLNKLDSELINDIVNKKYKQ